jgi:copper homeostasis protein
MKLEIAAFNLQSAINAIKAKADRIELCEDYVAGGITPSIELTKTVLNASDSIPTRVMIRPRGGNFVYDNSEFAAMKNSIIEFKKQNINGFVFGILEPDNRINIEQNRILVELAYPLPCTFHRAFDHTLNFTEALHQLIALNFEAVLTSGGKTTVSDGLQNLKAIIHQAHNKINIVAGGGIRSSNINSASAYIQPDYFHSAAIVDSTGIANTQEMEQLKNACCE